MLSTFKEKFMCLVGYAFSQGLWVISHVQGLVWEFLGEEREVIIYERKEEKRKDVYFVWVFKERKEKK